MQLLAAVIWFILCVHLMSVNGSYIIAGVTSSKCVYNMSSSNSSIEKCPTSSKLTPIAGWALVFNSSSQLLIQLASDTNPDGTNITSISYDRYIWPSSTPSSSVSLTTAASYNTLNVLSTGNHFTSVHFHNLFFVLIRGTCNDIGVAYMVVTYPSLSTIAINKIVGSSVTQVPGSITHFQQLGAREIGCLSIDR
jgi:hypothetical protein